MDDDDADEIAGEPIAEENAGGPLINENAAGVPILDVAGQPILYEEAEEITGVPLIDNNAGVSPAEHTGMSPADDRSRLYN